MTAPDLASVRRRFLLLTCLRWAPVGLTIPVSVLVMAERGLGPATIGLVLAAQGVVVLLLELPTGGLADAIGRRPVLVVATLFHVLGLVVFLLARAPWAFAAASACKGVFRALDSGPLQAWYVDAAQAADPDADIESGLSRAGVVIGASIAAGSAASALVAWVAPAVGATPGRLVGPAALPVLVAAVLATVQAVAVAVLVTEVGRPRGWAALRASVRDVPRIVRGAGRLVRADLGIRLLLGAEVAWALGQTGLEVLWPVRLAELVPSPGDAAALAGVVSVAMWVAAAAGSGAVPWARRRLGSPARVAAAARVLQGGAFVAMALAGGPLLLGAALAAGLVGNGATSPVHAAMLHRRVDASARTTLLSMNSLAGVGAGSLANVLVGATAAGIGIPWTWVLGATVLVASAPVYLRVGAPPPRLGPAVAPAGPRS